MALFGSVMRNEAGPNSDLDILAEFEVPHTAEQYFQALFLIEDSLGAVVDLADPSSLHPAIRDKVIADASFKEGHPEIPWRSPGLGTF